MLKHRASRMTKWAPAGHKPKGTGVFAPNPAGFVSTIVPLCSSTKPLTLSQTRHVRMVQYGYFML
jgi:hypothetical protein